MHWTFPFIHNRFETTLISRFLVINVVICSISLPWLWTLLLSNELLNFRLLVLELFPIVRLWLKTAFLNFCAVFDLFHLLQLLLIEISFFDQVFLVIERNVQLLELSCYQIDLLIGQIVALLVYVGLKLEWILFVRVFLS